jgi:hypothetical protein
MDLFSDISRSRTTPTVEIEDSHSEGSHKDEEEETNNAIAGLQVPSYVSVDEERPEEEDKPPVDPQTPCTVCGSQDPSDPMLICDGCGVMVHARCMDDALPEGVLPAGDYYCLSCRTFDILETEDKKGEYLDIHHDMETLDYLKSGSGRPSARVLSRAKAYSWDEGEGVIKQGTRVVPTPEQRQPLALAAHVKLGHRGYRAVADALRPFYVWKNMREDVKAAVCSCEGCAKKGLMPVVDKELHSIPRKPLFEKWTIDLIGPMAVEDAETKALYILTCVENCSGWVETSLLKDKKSATVLRALKASIFYRYGAPLEIACDRGGEFYGDVAEYCAQQGTKMVRGAAYHPQSQGLVERVNRTLQESLCSYLHDKPANTWGDYVDQAAMAAGRMLKHSSTKYAPYYVLYGTEPRNPAPAAVQPGAGSSKGGPLNPPTEAEVEKDMGERHKAKKEAEKTALLNHAKAQEKQQRDYKARVAGLPGPPVAGTKVYVESKKRGQEHLEGPYTYKGAGGKKSIALLEDAAGNQFEVTYGRLKVMRIA